MQETDELQDEAVEAAAAAGGKKDKDCIIM